MKHFSFDLWLTLIKSNPHFKNERVNFFHKNYNFSNNTATEIKTVFRRVDLMCNQVNESVGYNLDAKEIYLMVLYLLNENTINYSEINIDALYDQMESLALNYVPLILNDKVVPILDTLKEKDKTINLLSNTGFIKGDTIDKILCSLDLKKYFDFEIYSDQFDLSKPNYKLFEIVYNKTAGIYSQDISSNEIMHVGDNPVADIEGAKKFGMSTFLLDNTLAFNNFYNYAKTL